VREQLGVVFQMPSLDVKLTAQENLLHQGHLYGLSGGDLAGRIERALQSVGLADRRHERVERFSGGMRRRVELAKALLHDPRLMLLDEPSTGLDPGARRDVWDRLEHLRRERGVTIALTTHLMDEADRCDRLAILARGRLVAVDTPANLKARIGGDVVTVEAEDQSPEAVERLAREITQRFAPWPGKSAPAVVDGRIRFEHANGPAFVATLAAAFPGRVRSLSVGRPTLEDVFLQLTGQRLWDEPLTPSPS
jgi:ABC-2 type transport system ATP-binding protein